MKAIIADDERHVRNLLRMAIDWESLGIDRLLEAADGDEAQRIISEERPEIIITDMRMPKQDGIALLRALSELSYPHRTIVVSGYDDYPYLKKTIEYGGFDYFIKPIDEAELLVRLKTGIAEIKREIEEAQRRQQFSMLVNGQKWMNRNQLLNQWMDQPDSFAQIRAFFRDELAWTDGESCLLAEIHINVKLARVKQLFGERSDLLYFALVNIADEVLQFPRLGLAFHYLSKEGIVLLLIKTDEAGEAVRLCREISQRIEQNFGFPVEIAIGPAAPFPEGMKSALHTVESIRMQRNLLSPEPDGIYHAGHVVSCGIASLLDEKNEVKRIVAAAHYPEIESVVQRILQPCHNTGTLQLKQVEWWEQELVWLKTYLISASEPFPDGPPAFSFGELSLWDESGRFSAARLESSLQAHLMYLAEQSDSLRGGKKKETIYQIREYLRSSYHRPIQIQELSEKFYMNPEYLARLFKQEFQVGVKSFLTELRIDHAKRLLANRNVKIGEIAEMVGFADEKYFSKVFKKETSLSPQQYRLSQETGNKRV